MGTHPAPPAFNSRDRIPLGAVAVLGLLLGVVGILHYGYMGQDFNLHHKLLATFPRDFTYQLTNPPGLYWIGSLIRNHISATYHLELLALLMLLLNTLGLVIFYSLIWRMISNPHLRLAAAAIATFVPFRIIHSIVLSADAFTLPVFALAAVSTLRLADNPRRWGSWVGLSLCLTVGLFFKYTIVCLLPPAALVLALALWRNRSGGKLAPLAGAFVLAFALPSVAYLYQMNEGKKAGGEGSPAAWLPPGHPQVMRWRDVLHLQSSDWNLLAAPEYDRDELYGHRKYSYPGLLYVTSFTDSLNVFQKAPEGIPYGLHGRPQDTIVRGRTALSQRLQVLSVYACIPLAILALAGTLACSVLSLPSLLFQWGKLPQTAAVLTAMALGMYLPIVISLPKLFDPYTPGYWLPRLVLVPLVVFLILGFVGIDLLLPQDETKRRFIRLIPKPLLVYSLATCMIFAGFLI